MELNRGIGLVNVTSMASLNKGLCILLRCCEEALAVATSVLWITKELVPFTSSKFTQEEYKQWAKSVDFCSMGEFGPVN